MGGRKTGVSPPQDPFCIAQFLSYIAKNVFWKNLSVFVDRTKNIFGRIVFRPNIQANQGFVRIKSQKQFRKMNFCKISPIFPQKCC